jgi:thiol-disulfide isomerase/thioredoxin
MKEARDATPDTADLDVASAPAATAEPAAPRRRALLALVGVVGLIAAVQAFLRTRAASRASDSLVFHSPPRELPRLRFVDGQGAATSLTAWRGKVVLLNVWATWCPPCIKEMPSLDRLQATLGGPDFQVVALSIDAGGLPAVQAFFGRNDIKHLLPYIDAFHAATTNLIATGIPLTLLIDRDGRELARNLGPAEWDGPATVQLIREQLHRTTINPTPAGTGRP